MASRGGTETGSLPRACSYATSSQPRHTSKQINDLHRFAAFWKGTRRNLRGPSTWMPCPHMGQDIDHNHSVFIGKTSWLQPWTRVCLPFFLEFRGGGLSSEGLCKCDYSPHSDSGQDLLSLVSNWQLDMWQTGFLISAKPAWRSKSPECISHQLQFRFYQITRFKWTQMHI